jgi:aspartyl-tRNA(Asn)/glutamyl-tRNA(Gln) amidotransferase subunit A
MKISEFARKVQSGEIDVIKHTKKVIDDAKKINKDYSYFNVISDELALEQAEAIAKQKFPKGRLAGVPISVKDCIVVRDVESTAGSRILKGYIPLFNATAVQRCIDEGAIIIGKTSQDEFGFGGFAVNTGLDYKKPLNPFDKDRATGGSSGGSAGITQKADFAHVSLGESTGGSIVNPASFCGVYGLCPTYGRVSRYGLIDYGNSLDKIGPMSKNIEDAALVQEIISGFDEKESTTLNAPVEDYSKLLGKGTKGMKIGVIKEGFGEGVDSAVSKRVWDGIKQLESAGAKYEEVSLPLTIKYGLSVYYLIATSESSTNLQKYCGMRYGKHEKLEGSFNEYFTKVRSMHFGKEAKRRIMIGTFARMAGFRDAYYMKAMKVRTKIIQEYKALFKKYDVLVSPTVPILPPKFDEIKKLSLLQNYMIDILTVGPNLAGLPHLNVPVGFEKKEGKELPVGMMLIGDHLKEGKILQAGNSVKAK